MTETDFVCPEAESHGTPFRYCGVPGCGWTEQVAAKTPVAAATTVQIVDRALPCTCSDPLGRLERGQHWGGCAVHHRAGALPVVAEFVAAREAAAGDMERARLADRMAVLAVLAEQVGDPERAEFLREAAAWTRATKTHHPEVSE